MKPNFLIIGGMKCGTTALTEYLKAHPDVFIASPKEMHFFDRNYENGWDWYESHFVNATGFKAVGESTAHYSYDEAAHERIARRLPDARLIMMVRDPVERAHSQYWHARTRGREHLTFSESLEAEPGRLASGNEVDRWTYSYVDRGNYARQLRSLMQHFDHSRIHVVILEELQRDPAQTYQKICRFLNVDDEQVPDIVGQKVNPFVRHRSTVLRRVTGSMPGLMRRAVGKLNRVSGVYPDLDGETRQALAKEFARSNSELAKLIGRDLSTWWTVAA